MGLFDQGIATLGNILNLPEWGISEALGGGNQFTQQTQPYGGQIWTGAQNYSPVPNNYTGGTSTGNWQGASTGPVYTSTNAENFSTGGGTYQVPQQTQQTSSTSSGYSAPSYEDQMRNSINSGWDSYINSLNDMLSNTLPGQKTAQENIANTSYQSGVNQLGTQKASSEQAVNKQQVTNLKDLAENVQNLFQSGNIYLGSRGAGDSSAANQYSYAVSKMGTKARGDIMSQASDRLNQISDIYNSEVNRLQSDLNTRINEIADWFNNAKGTIMQQVGSAGLNKQKDIQALATNMYNQALQATQAIQQEAAQRQQILQTWAANNATNVQQLITNLKQVQQMPQFQGLSSGSPQVTTEGNYYVPTGYGTNTTQKKDLFGNIIG